MLRQVPIGFALVWFAAGAGEPGAANPTDPPSSLEGVAQGSLKLKHSHSRVRACAKRTKNGAITCKAETEPAGARASLRLVPIRNSRIAGKDPRRTHAVELGDEGTLEEPLELRVGPWDLDWTGTARRARFHVAEGDELTIRLVSETGACQVVRGECSLQTSATSRKILVPRDRAR